VIRRTSSQTQIDFKVTCAHESRAQTDPPNLRDCNGNGPSDPRVSCGKTKFARQLERDLPAIRFSQDEWMAHLYGNDPPPDEFPIFFQRISELIARLWPRCLELGVDVILDLNFWSREERDETRATASALGASTTLYRLSCTDEEAWRRIEHRNRNLNGDLFINRATFDALKVRFEPLSDDEERIDILVDSSPIISGWRYRIA
jgi:predicted kinase